MNILGRRVKTPIPRLPSPAEKAIAGANGRFPSVVTSYSRSNPYKPQVSAVDFPIVTLPVGRWVPPSINPQPGRPRNRSTPNPTGYTVPSGAFTGKTR